MLLPGTIIADRYRIDRMLGSGGFGEVYAAFQLDSVTGTGRQSPGREVAIKLLRTNVVWNAEAHERFRQEAELAKHLQHPHTIRLFDFGRTAEGVAFIVFELLRGEALDRVLEQGPMPVPRIIKISIMVLKALMEAHASGIVHRDIKPANIFLCEYAGEPDFVKVLDFGIARAPQDDGPSITTTGAAIGTPAYMSPEQMLSGRVDTRADLHSLGLTMAEAVTGVPVYAGLNAIRIGMAQMTEDPVPLSSAVLESPIGPIIARACEKDPSRRYANALAMIRDLEQVKAGKFIAIGASRPPESDLATQDTVLAVNGLSGGLTPAPDAKSGRRNVLIGLAGVGTVLVMGGIGGIVALNAEQDAEPEGDGEERRPPVETQKKAGGAKKSNSSPQGPAVERVGPHYKLRGFEVRSRSARDILGALAKWGYELNPEPIVNEIKGGFAINYVFEHTAEPEQGTVQFHVYESEGDAADAAQVHRRTFAIVRDGRRCLLLMFNRDVEYSRTRLRALLG